MNQKKTMGVKQVVLMGMFGALAGVLMVFEIPLPFIAPSFYGLDFSEVPVLVGTFSMGPVAGVIIELVKILVHLVSSSSSSRPPRAASESWRTSASAVPFFSRRD